MQLRPYQTDLVQRFYASSGHSGVVLATGGGKTVVMSAIVDAWPKDEYIVVLAHRQELVSQISTTLARDGVNHTIMASRNVIKTCCKLHMHSVGKCHYRVTSNVIVASVQTLVRRKEVEKFADRVTLCIVDEFHHVLKTNIWGRAFSMFPNARALGFSATPIRCDKKALGSQYDGVFDQLIVGKSMVELMDEGFLCPYKVYNPTIKSLDLSAIKIGSTGDYTQKSLSSTMEKPKIYGDVVEAYVKFAAGTQGVTFVPSVKMAAEVAQAFTLAGVPAAVVSAKTPDLLRVSLVEDLAAGRLLQLVNVDLFGEGFDLPSVTTVIMARPTKSYALFSQQLGRALRPADGKTHAIIIDLVGNVMEHGLPEFNDYWTLGYYGSRGPSGGTLNKWKACVNCTQVFIRYLKTCPWCGHEVVPVATNSIEVVDGDLTELDPEVLEQLRREKLRQYGNAQVPHGAPGYVQEAVRKRWDTRRSQLEAVKWFVDEWCGREISTGLSEGEVMRKFYLVFGMDVLSALTCRDEAFVTALEGAVL